MKLDAFSHSRHNAERNRVKFETTLGSKIMIWITPPECQGQIVEESYTTDRESWIYKRILDRSDREVRFCRADLADYADQYDPVNARPDIPSDAWEECTEPKGE